MSSTSTTWTTDTNTKSGTVQIYDSSVSTLRITAGESTDAILELFADEGDDNADKWRLWVNDADDDLHFASYTTGSWANLLTIQDGGNVGIGTASPLSSSEVGLHIYNTNDSINTELRIESDSTGGGTSPNNLLTMKREDVNRHNQLQFYTDTTFKWGLGQTDSDGSGVDGAEFYIGQTSGGASAAFYINDDDNVGIGTSAPVNDLHIKGAGTTALTTSLLTLEDSSATNGNFCGTLYATRPVTSNVGKTFIGVIRTASYGRNDIVFACDNAADDNPVASGDEVMRITSAGNVGIGTTSPDHLLEISHNEGSVAVAAATIADNTVLGLHIAMTGDNDNDGSVLKFSSATDSINTAIAHIQKDSNSAHLAFYTEDSATFSEKMRIESGGNVFIGQVAQSNPAGNDVDGTVIGTTTGINSQIEADAHKFGRGQDGAIMDFYSAGGVEGALNISGSTFSLSGFSGNHESSGIDSNTDTGTVVSAIDELDTYIDDIHPKKGQIRENHPKVKISDSAGDTRVFGVVSKVPAQDGKVLIDALGISAVRVTGACEGGDLLESNGDGTAKVQSDDMIKSKTIGKVTIGNSDSGVKLVSCVLYCG